jgi:HAD superfamily hydrolase (TIGR01490 family)
MENSGLIVFDVDGTLLPGTSCERLFFRHLMREGMIRLRNLVGFGLRGIELMPNGLAFVLKANKGYLRGFSRGYIAEIGRVFFKEEVSHKISKKGIMQVKEHLRNGDRTMLLSGMPEFLLRNFSEYLEVDDYVGSVLEVNSDTFTGRTVGAFPLAQGKVEVLEPLLEKHRLSWPQVTAYADHGLDRFLLEKVGSPVAVNPREDLRRIAERRGWRIETFG